MKLILVRGLPGSGKSTFAKSLGIAHYEADMFFMQNGVYNFNPLRIKDAHNWCKQQVFHELFCNNSVVVSNTFSQIWEMKEYLYMAKELKAEIEVIKMTGNYKNIHGVPAETIEKMRNRWEDFQGEIIK